MNNDEIIQDYLNQRPSQAGKSMRKSNINYFLESIKNKNLLKINIRDISSYFSKLNNNRYLLGCNEEDRDVLLCHAPTSVNAEHYLKIDLSKKIKLFDQWNPYKAITI